MHYVDGEYETINGTVVGIDIFMTVADQLKMAGIYLFYLPYTLYKSYKKNRIDTVGLEVVTSHHVVC
jgi:hypothetical protein